MRRTTQGIRRRPSVAARAPERAAGLRGTTAADARLRGALMEIFVHLDADGNGELTDEQFAAGQRILFECSGADIDYEAFAIAGCDETRLREANDWLEWAMDHMVPVLRETKVRLATRIEAWAAANIHPD